MTAPARPKTSSTPVRAPRSGTPSRLYVPRRTVDLPLFRSAENYNRFRRMVAGLFRLEAHMTEVRRRVAERFGLGLSHHMILTAVAEQQGPAGVTVRDLAAYMRVSGPFIAAETKTLASRGLLLKADDPADRRRSLLQLSQEGCRYVDEVADVIRPVNNRAFRSLDPARLDEFEGILEKLLLDAVEAESVLDAGLPVAPSEN